MEVEQKKSKKMSRSVPSSGPRADQVAGGGGKASQELGLSYSAAQAVFVDRQAPTRYPGMVSNTNIHHEGGIIERVYAASVYFSNELKYHTSLMHWKHEIKYPQIWRALHKKSVLRGIVRTIQERAGATTSDIKPSWEEQLVIMGGRYVEVAKALLITPPIPGIHKGTFCHLLHAILPKPSMKNIECHQHTVMQTQGPEQFLIALLFFMLGRLRYHCTCDEDADEEPFPEQVVPNIVFGLGEVWKYMRSDTIGKVEETENILTECNATVAGWAALAADTKTAAESLAPNTIPAKTVGAIRMIVSRTLELNPVLLGSNKYATLRANILRVQEAVDIQAGAWCRLGTNRLTNPSLPYPTLKTEKMAPHLYRGMSERRTIAPISEVIPAFAAVEKRDLQKAFQRSTSPPEKMPWDNLPDGSPGLLRGDGNASRRKSQPQLAYSFGKFGGGRVSIGGGGSLSSVPTLSPRAGSPKSPPTAGSPRLGSSSSPRVGSPMGSVTMGGGGRAEKTTLKNSPSVRSSVGRGVVRGGGGGGAGGSNMGSAA